MYHQVYQNRFLNFPTEGETSTDKEDLEIETPQEIIQKCSQETEQSTHQDDSSGFDEKTTTDTESGEGIVKEVGKQKEGIGDSMDVKVKARPGILKVSDASSHQTNSDLEHAIKKQCTIGILKGIDRDIGGFGTISEEDDNNYNRQSSVISGNSDFSNGGRHSTISGHSSLDSGRRYSTVNFDTQSSTMSGSSDFSHGRRSSTISGRNIFSRGLKQRVSYQEKWKVSKKIKREMDENFSDYMDNGDAGTLENYHYVVCRVKMSANVRRRSMWEGISEPSDIDPTETRDGPRGDTFWETVQEFGQNTSIHGLRQVMEKQPFNIRRCFLYFYTFQSFKQSTHSIILLHSTKLAYAHE